MARHFKSAATAPRHFKAGVLDHLTPAAGDVLTGHAAWDPHGASGTYHAPEASEVAFGAVVGTTTGTYQLTATTQAADAAILEAQKDHLSNTETVTFGASHVDGTLDLGLYQLKTDSVLVAAIGATIVKDGSTITATSGATHVDGTYSPGGTFTEGQANQLATDVAAVTAVLGSITTDVQNLLGDATLDGTLNMGLYTLITGVVAAVDVRKDTPRYTGGSNGSCYVPAAAVVISPNNVDATTGTYVDPAEADVKKNVAYGVSPRHGEYDPMAAAVFPAAADVNSTDVAYGPTGAEYAGALNMGLYELVTTGDTRVAAQHDTDAAFLETNKDEIVTTDADILAEFGVTGTAVEVGGGTVVIDTEGDIFTST
jgi:hypothetical protein